MTPAVLKARDGDHVALAELIDNVAGGDFLWCHSHPSKAVRMIASSSAANPLVVFDEIEKVTGNSGGKTRMSKSTALQDRLTWKIMVLSTGEVSSATALKGIGKTRRGGQSVRMLDIRVADRRLLTLPVKDGKAPSHDREILGFRDETHFYLLSQTFADIHKGRNSDASARLLEESGHLERGGERNSLLYRVPKAGEARPRAYRITRTILDE